MEIIVKNLTKSFKKICVLNNVNANFQSGNIYGLCGRNGSGKTVFLKLLCGLYMPNEGSITYDNQEINLNNNHLFKINALIENPKFFPELTGYENLKILADIKKEIGEKELLQVLKLVNLIEEKDKKFGQYSLGMKQKLGIAQVLMENPDIIILDEPFNGIENKTVKKIKQILVDLKNEGKLIIISSHIKEDLLELSNQIYYFDNGEISLKNPDEE